MTPLVLRLLNAAILCDKWGLRDAAKAITEAIKEIEDARLIRGTADEGAEQSGHPDKCAGPRDRDQFLDHLWPEAGQAGCEHGNADEAMPGA